PTDTVKPGMQLFSGERRSDGQIDWVNPQPLDHTLHGVDIHLLDFYPPAYLDSLASCRYDRFDKKFTDSLYYSLAAFFHTGGDGLERVRDTIRDTPRSSPLPVITCGIN